MTNNKEKLRSAIASAVCNAGNYPKGVRHTVLGADMTNTVDAVLEAVLATGLLKDLETAQELAKKAPFEEGDIVREVGQEETTGEIIQVKHATGGYHETAYLVKLYRPITGFKSITYYADEIELIERPGK